MNRLAFWLLPAVAAGVVAFAQIRWYPEVMAQATAWTVAWVPPEPAPTDIQVRDDRLRILGAPQPRLVAVLTIGWNLPVLICLWGWVVRRRWLWLLAASLLFLLAHVLVTDLAIRRSLGDLSGFPNSLYRAWFIWIAPLLPVVCVGMARFAVPAAETEAAG